MLAQSNTGLVNIFKELSLTEKKERIQEFIENLIEDIIAIFHLKF